MPFVALNTTTNTPVDINDVKGYPHSFPKGHWACQLCNQPMLIRGGTLISRHFYHFKNCESEYVYHTESAQHRLGKRYIAEQLRKEFWKYHNASIKLEVPIPEIKRVADVLVTLPNDWQIAHECQLSPIQVAEYEARSNDYFSAGIDVYWWLGLKASLVKDVREWMLSQFGFMLLVDFNDRAKAIPD